MRGVTDNAGDALSTENRALRARVDQLEKQEKELRARLRGGHRMETLGRLASGIAHDFNNLLTIILGGAQMVRYGHRTTQAIIEIEGAARSAGGLTRRLLALSRRSPVAPRALDLRKAVESLYPLMSRAAGTAIRTTVAYADEQCTVRIDESSVQQIFLNLVVNARDAMPVGGTLDIRVERTALESSSPDLPAGAYVLATVRDSGVGMDRPTLAHVFEPFFTTKETDDDIGLGLSLVREAMAECGGVIRVDSEPGQGTTFRLYFPVVETERAARTRNTQVPFMRPHVLLVESNGIVRRVVGDALRRIAASVTAVEGGKEAIAVWQGRATPIDLLVTDVLLLEMKGPDVAKTLLAVDPELRVLFMTGEADSVDMTEFPGSGIIRKPFDTNDLSQAIGDVLNAR